MGNNFGGLTVPLITGFLLASGNWQASFLLLAGLTYLMALLSVAIVREQPSIAVTDPANTFSAPPAPALTGWTTHEALRSKSFYVLTLAMMLGSFTYSAVLPQVSDHLIATGMPRTTVPLAISLLAAFGMIGKLSFGYLSERFTARRMMMASLGGQVVFVVLMVNFPTPPLAWLVVPMFGLFMGSYGTLTTLVIQETFGLRHFGSIAGLVALATVVPFFVGPLLAGASFDLTDSYSAGFVIVAAMFAIAVVALTQVEGPEPVPRKTG
jgi:MFS family permease